MNVIHRLNSSVPAISVSLWKIGRLAPLWYARAGIGSASHASLGVMPLLADELRVGSIWELEGKPIF